MYKAYWRQRFTQRLVQFGDENTKKIHAMATERYRTNVICQIMDVNGRMVSDHNEKSALFFQEFRRRLGTSVDTSMQFDLQLLIQPCSSLEDLCQPFSKDEIDAVILDLPNDKAPGPDGFNSFSLGKLGTSLKKTCIGYAWISTLTWLILKVLIIHISL